MDNKRRNVLAGLGMVATAGLGATHAIAQSDSDKDDATGPAPEITELREEAEWIMIENLGTGTYDASNHWVEFEYKGEVHQRRQLPEGTELGSVLIATGAEDVENADITFDYEQGVLNDDKTDAVALLTPDEEVVAFRYGAAWEGDDGSSNETTIEETTTEETTTTEEETTTTTEETTTTDENSGSESDSGSDSGGSSDGSTDEEDSSSGAGGSSGSDSESSSGDESGADGEEDC